MGIPSEQRNPLNRENRMAERFVISRIDHYELTTVGADGTENVHTDYPIAGPAPDGQVFTDEGSYRRAIERAVEQATERRAR